MSDARRDQHTAHAVVANDIASRTITVVLVLLLHQFLVKPGVDLNEVFNRH
jgi:hypothetical protein